MTCISHGFVTNWHLKGIKALYSLFRLFYLFDFFFLDLDFKAFCSRVGQTVTLMALPFLFCSLISLF